MPGYRGVPRLTRQGRLGVVAGPILRSSTPTPDTTISSTPSAASRVGAPDHRPRTRAGGGTVDGGRSSRQPGRRPPRTWTCSWSSCCRSWSAPRPSRTLPSTPCSEPSDSSWGDCVAVGRDVARSHSRYRALGVNGGERSLGPLVFERVLRTRYVVRAGRWHARSRCPTVGRPRSRGPAPNDHQQHAESTPMIPVFVVSSSLGFTIANDLCSAHAVVVRIRSSPGLGSVRSRGRTADGRLEPAPGKHTRADS